MAFVTVVVREVCACVCVCVYVCVCRMPRMALSLDSL